jgi:acetyltransferase EpsM
MYIYGTGGIAVVAAEVLNDCGVGISGFYDDDPGKHSFLGHNVQPGLSLNENLILPSDGKSLICIGDNPRRAKLTRHLRADYGLAIHPSAIVSPSATIGAGTLVFHGSKIQAGAQLGRGIIVNTGGSIDHECIIADFAHIAPNVTLCGYVEIGEGANIGAASVVIPSVKIGKWATVGAGTIVIKDIPDYAVAVGSPARIIKTNVIPAGLEN